MKWTLPVIAVLTAAVAPLLADSTYQDPGHQFTLTIPAGWTSSTGQGGFQLSRGTAYVNVLTVNGQGSARGLVVRMEQQIGTQWKEFQPFDPQEENFGGQPGALAMAMGTNPRGIRAFLAVYAVVLGDRGFVMVQSGPFEEMKNLQEDMDHVAKSFVPGPAPAQQGEIAGRMQQPSVPKATETSGANYSAPDGSLSIRIPAGWRASATTIGTTPVQVLQPDNGDGRILVAVAAATVNSIQELAQQAVQVVTQQLLPGSQLLGQPKFLQSGGAPVVELSYSGPGGQSIWWQAVMLKDRQSVTALGGARRQDAAMIEQQSRAVFDSIRPGTNQSAPVQSSQLAQLIVGHWTWYHRTDNGGGGTVGSTSKEIWIYPNGRYQYTAVTYVPNMPPGIDPSTTLSGTYQLQGNRIVVRADNGQTATLTVEIVENGKAIKLDGEVYIKD